MGEALMDVVTTDQGTTSHPGGSPANVAVGLARLEVGASLLTQLGGDKDGETIRRHLESEGVRLLEVGEPSCHRTSTATATLNADGSAKYAFDIEWSLPPQPLPEQFEIIHSGSIAAFLPPGASAVRAMFEQNRGISLLSFDPNIRPQLLPDHACALEQFESMSRIVDIIKLSDEDAAWLYPYRSEDFIADALHEQGVKLVIVTRGKHGAMLSTSAHYCLVPATSETVVDTIGAGDSYMAAILQGVYELGHLPNTMQELESIGKIAARAAGITVSRAGSQPPTLKELFNPKGTRGQNPSPAY
ncbi:carbohydrate kinase [Pseudarthrobacter equi]|uniref:carbohydrate kinase family protein n=1 Tax=Pseudarthrobacter equi TaxID=728066 RepID=UPI0021C11EA8|nr:carbohydrate kinase [Pseudarthrobacter equi]